MAVANRRSSAAAATHLSESLHQPGRSPEGDAWFAAFFIENHLDFYTNPTNAASDEQVRFMVYTEDNERYYPCSDKMFAAIMNRNQSAFIQKQYNQVLQRILALIESQIEDAFEKAYLESLIITKYQHETRDEIMIPSRVEKRLMKIFINRTRIEDPFHAEKAARNQRALQVLGSPRFQAALNHVDKGDLRHPPETLADIKAQIAAVEFRRLLSAACSPALWATDKGAGYSEEDFLALFARPFSGNGLEALLGFLGLSSARTRARKILWLADEAGQVMLDLAVIRFLVGMGHKVIIAFKSGPLYTKVDISDMSDNGLLQRAVGNAAFIDTPHISKNDLVRLLRGDTPVLAFADGTSENFNLIMASTTFARVFKEVDGVVSRGPDQRRRFFDSHFQFTQDVFSVCDESDGVSILYKPRHPAVIKFSHEDLETKARAIIDQMRSAKEKGHTVIFYSGIIGSIPGKIKMAKTIMSVFVGYLKSQSAMTFIINPSEYYEPGMDADDLMYMWELVQRSGMVDIWRFQTYDDIVRAFQIMNKKIPPEWVGKDATYSTGCTKEMKIALEVQARHPEMQLIGPARERFMRRQEYGIGKMYDKRLAEIC